MAETLRLITVSSPEFEKLMEIVGLPKTVTWFKIEWEASLGQLVVECGYLPEARDGED